MAKSCYATKLMKHSTKFVAVNAVVAALYVALTLPFGALATNSFVQIRPAEALTILPALFPYTVVGLTIGCAISNIVSAYGIYDILLGALVTFVAGMLTAKVFKKFWSAPIPPVVLNATLLPLIWLLGGAEAGVTTYFVNALSLLISQSIACFGLGIPLYFFADKTLRPLIELN